MRKTILGFTLAAMAATGCDSSGPRYFGACCRNDSGDCATVVSPPETGSESDVLDSASDTVQRSDARRAPPSIEGEPTWTLTGEVIVDGPVACTEAPIYVALSAACGSWSKVHRFDQLAGTAGRYLFEVPDGLYHLVAFADCSLDADPSAPAPSSGDLTFHVTTDTEDRPCRTYRLAGAGYIDLPVVIATQLPGGSS